MKSDPYPLFPYWESFGKRPLGMVAISEIADAEEWQVNRENKYLKGGERERIITRIKNAWWKLWVVGYNLHLDIVAVVSHQGDGLTPAARVHLLNQAKDLILEYKRLAQFLYVAAVFISGCNFM